MKAEGESTEGLESETWPHFKCVKSSYVTHGAGQDLELTPVRTLWKPLIWQGG